ncbi:nuclear transport factor 2 family protein [Providencia hangzhouensis]
MNNMQLVKQALNAVLGEDIGSRPVAQKYFSDEYIQIVDGKKINFNEFIAHLQALKQATQSITITIKSIAEGENCVHTQHLAKAIKKDGSVSEFEVFACFQIANNKIIRCDQQQMLKSAGADQDLGSRT